MTALPSSPVAALRSSASVEWGTPLAVVEMAREVLGRIDVDPCSSDYWDKHVVKADQAIDEAGDALDGDWYWKPASTFFINPPGKQVKEFWRFARARWLEGSSVFWVGFSLEQMLYLQREGLFFEGFVRALPSKRLRYLRPVEGGPPVPGPAPTHGSYLALLPSAHEQVERFRALAKKLPAEVF